MSRTIKHIIIWNYSNRWLKPVLVGVGGSLHLPLPSMNRLNLIDPATCALLLFWAFISGFIFSVFLTLFPYLISVPLFFRRGYTVLQLDKISGGVYNISPCTFRPREEGPFFLDLNCSVPFTVTQLRWPYNWLAQANSRGESEKGLSSSLFIYT